MTRRFIDAYAAATWYEGYWYPVLETPGQNPECITGVRYSNHAAACIHAERILEQMTEAIVTILNKHKIIELIALKE